MALVYRYWLRVEASGVENVPEGRVLLIANHAGNTFAWDGAMLGMALFLDGDPPRVVRGMGEYYLPTIPFFSVFMHRVGSVVGTPTNCAHLLGQEEAIMVFPEGERGFVKTFRQRYQLQRFGLGFMRLALETDTPIVPVGIVGAEEQSPGLANLRSVGRLIGSPAFPVTLTFPWLGLAGFLPLPVKFRIGFGEPMRFSGDPSEEDASVEKKVEQVKAADPRADRRRTPRAAQLVLLTQRESPRRRQLRAERSDSSSRPPQAARDSSDKLASSAAGGRMAVAARAHANAPRKPRWLASLRWALRGAGRARLRRGVMRDPGDRGRRAAPRRAAHADRSRVAARLPRARRWPRESRCSRSPSSCPGCAANPELLLGPLCGLLPLGVLDGVRRAQARARSGARRLHGSGARGRSRRVRDQRRPISARLRRRRSLRAGCCAGASARWRWLWTVLALALVLVVPRGDQLGPASVRRADPGAARQQCPG